MKKSLQSILAAAVVATGIQSVHAMDVKALATNFAQSDMAKKLATGLVAGAAGGLLFKHSEAFLGHKLVKDTPLPSMTADEIDALIDVNPSDNTVNYTRLLEKHQANIKFTEDAAERNMDKDDLRNNLPMNFLNMLGEGYIKSNHGRFAAHCAVNGWNFWRSAKWGIVDVITKWWNNTKDVKADLWSADFAKKAGLALVAATAGAATAYLPLSVDRTNAWKDSALRFTSRGFLRSQLMKWVYRDLLDISKEEFRTYRSIADACDIGLDGYYKATA